MYEQGNSYFLQICDTYITATQRKNSEVMIQTIKYLNYLNRNLFPRTTLDLQKKGRLLSAKFKKETNSSQGVFQLRIFMRQNINTMLIVA